MLPETFFGVMRFMYPTSVCYVLLPPSKQRDLIPGLVLNLELTAVFLYFVRKKCPISGQSCVNLCGDF